MTESGLSLGVQFTEAELYADAMVMREKSKTVAKFVAGEAT
jgi:hypothetical protein